MTAAPSSAPSDSRSPRKTTASGIANMGAVDDSTVATATPACLTPATNITELTALRTLSPASRASTDGSRRRRPPSAPRAHGVTHSVAAASGSRIACAVTGSMSPSGDFRNTTETAHASAASVAVPTPSQKRSPGARWAQGATISVSPPSVRSVPAASAGVIGSSRNAAARRAAPTG
ncbi:MAG: hypothetical protein DME15_12940 [Candidatus Rokuibacteriota bacterium]|nr:MAG: hypothetical protein DME15_12940 [Candidatus Rokubacteria bacterium]PYN57215.1 MAG: hypothetical protein DMD92_14515 [Candidatus Rokubacteria bacterium]